MKTYTLIAGAVVAALLIGIVVWMTNARVATAPEGVVCTADAQLCPDGSYVGRTGPNCEFAACPAPSETNPVRVEAGMGETVNALGVTLTPLAIVEDSRCPVDVQCIQAGTVRVSVRIVSGLGTSTSTFKLGQAITTEAESITLTAVVPQKTSTVTIKNAEYRFTFEVAKRPSVSAGSGVEGTIVLGPTCPVERTPADPSCDDKPYSTSISVRASGSSTVVATTKSTATGAFKITLPPGAYTLLAEGGTVLPRCAVANVTVAPDTYTTVALSCDTGIR